MRILVVAQSNYGKRIVKNIRSFAPSDWEITIWEAPFSLPLIVEDPEEFIPRSIPRVDLLLSLGENPAVAELIPALVKLSHAKEVIAPVDNRDWLPLGLKNQIKRDLESYKVSCVFPLPFCSLDEKASKSEYIRLFARYFGKPKFVIECSGGKIQQIKIKRETPCGSTRFLTRKLVGVEVKEAEKKAGLLHHYYPCLASGKISGRFRDSLLHISANITMAQVRQALISCRK